MEFALDEIGDVAEPITRVRNIVIKNRRIPGNIRRPDDMWERSPFVIGVRTNRGVSKTINYIQGMDIIIVGNDTLESTRNFHGTVVNNVLIVFKLEGRMDTLSSTDDSILMHNCNDWAFLGFNDTANSTNSDVGDFVVINTADMTERSDRAITRTSEPAIPPLASLLTREPYEEDPWVFWIE